MNNYKINRWKDSANESFLMVGRSLGSFTFSGYLPFYVDTEQKEYLENHIDEIDDWCEDERHFGKKPVTIKFEEDWDGMEKCYTCECYFEEWYNK